MQYLHRRLKYWYSDRMFWYVTVSRTVGSTPWQQMSLGGCVCSPWAHTGWVGTWVADEQSACQLLVLADQWTGVDPSQIFSANDGTSWVLLSAVLTKTALSLGHAVMKSHLKIQGQGLGLNAKPFVRCYGHTVLALHCQNGTTIVRHNRLESKHD